MAEAAVGAQGWQSERPAAESRADSSRDELPEQALSLSLDVAYSIELRSLYSELPDNSMSIQ